MSPLTTLKKSRKLILHICFSLIIIGTYSCSKKQDWKCTCTVGSSGTAPSGATYTTSITNATQNNAGDLCNTWGSNQIATGTYSCNVTTL